MCHESAAGQPGDPTTPGAVSYPSEAFIAAFGMEPDGAATLVLVHSGPAAGEADIIHPPNDPVCHVCQMATNTKNQERLAKAKAIIDRDHASGTIGPEEYACYGKIIALAEANRWEEAEQLTIRFCRDQRH